MNNKIIATICLVLAVFSFSYGAYWMGQAKSGLDRSEQTLVQAQTFKGGTSPETAAKYEDTLRMSGIQADLAGEDKARSYPGLGLGVVLTVAAGALFLKSKKA